MAYGLKYRVPFASRNKEVFEVRILQDGYSGSVTELTGGVPPFILEYSSSDFLYEPLRFSSAILNVVGKDYLQELYSNNYQEYKVNLVKGSAILFTGYINPESYSQEFDGSKFALEVECISALSTLEYFPFDGVEAKYSFFDLIKNAIAKSGGDYANVYIPVTYSTMISNVLRELSMSSGNLFDEEGEPMTYKEILEEICRFLGWTVTEWEGSVYFIDIDYIKKKNSSYWIYPGTMATETLGVLDVTELVVNDSVSAGADNTLSIINAYNKATVIDSDYEVESDRIYPMLNNEENEKLMFSDSVAFKGKLYQKNFFRNLSLYEIIQYTYSSGTFVPTTFNILFPQNNAGACLISQSDFETADRPNTLTWEDRIQIKLFDGDYDGIPNNIPVMDDNGTSSGVDTSRYPIVRILQASPFLAFDTGLVMALDFQLQFSDQDDGFAIKERKELKDDKPKEEYYDEFYVPFQLRIGQYYFTGASYNSVQPKWTTTPTIFKCYTNITEDDHWIHTWLSARDTNDFIYGLGELTGTLIGFDRDIVGDVELTIYCPHSISRSRRDYKHRYSFLKNVSLKVQRVNHSRSGTKEDTVYSNDISDRYVSEMEDIRMKLTSKNESELSLSKVMQGNNLLDTLQNVIMGSAEKPESLLINRIVNQYSNPKYKLTESVKPLYTPFQVITDVAPSVRDKEFIMSSCSINYAAHAMRLTLIEIA